MDQVARAPKGSYEESQRGSEMKVLYFAELKDMINQQSESIDLSESNC